MRFNGKTVLVYGGMHKTGTSSTQNTIYDNKSRLEENGFHIVETGLTLDSREIGARHLPLASEMIREKQPGALWRSVADEIEACDAHSYIIMRENLFGPDIDPLWITSVFPGARLRLVICVRNAVDYMNSQYKERIHRVRETRNTDAFVAAQSGYIDVAGLCRKWADAIGRSNIVTVNYEQNCHALQRAILGRMTASHPFSLDDIRVPPSVNESLPNATCLKLLIRNRLRKDGIEVPGRVLEGIEDESGFLPGKSRILQDQDIAAVERLARGSRHFAGSSAVRDLPLDGAFHDAGVRRRTRERIMAACSAALLRA